MGFGWLGLDEPIGSLALASLDCLFSCPIKPGCFLGFCITPTESELGPLRLSKGRPTILSCNESVVED